MARGETRDNRIKAYQCVAYPGWPDDETAIKPGSMWRKQEIQNMAEVSETISVVVIAADGKPKKIERVVAGIAHGAIFKHTRTGKELVF